MGWEDESSSALPPPADGVRLIAPSARWRYQAFVAPPLPRQLGAAVWAAMDAAMGRMTTAALRGSLAGSASPPAALSARPATWPHSLPASAPSGPAPLGAAAPGGKCDCATQVATLAGQRVATLLATTSFSLSAADLRAHRLLELRLRYRDGVILWMNGVEVARRNLNAPALWQLADRPRGPEWETIYLPVTAGLLRAGENTLAVELRPSSSSDAPELALELYGRRDARIVRGPMVQGVGETAATLVVETDVTVAATLSWGPGGPGAPLVHDVPLPPAKRHLWALRELPRDRPVSYRITAGASQTPIHTFHTLPPPGAVLRIGVYGDVRGGHDIHRRLTQALIDEAPDAVLVTGDMVLRGSDEGDWQRFFAVTAELLPRIPYYPAIGNHDLGRSADGRRADQIFALPPPPPGRPEGAFWYSVDLADVHLVFLDSNAYERPEQEKWLEQDLAAARARNVRAILAVTHSGPYSRGIHKGSPLARERYVPILTRYKVNVLFSGHDHQYQRGKMNGLDYVVSGGGGASLYPISCGVPGKPRCKVEDGMKKVAKEYHYVMLTLTQSTLEMCTRRPDKTPLEPCVKLKLR
jgi:acid phosphatase type 7